MHSIFISSTFVDMQRERDIIQKNVCPVLDSFAKKNGDSVRVEDLRWGIDTSEDNSSVNILNTCFDAILETNPLMIALIGDRYGTLVNSENIKASMLNRKEKITETEPSSITELELKYASVLNPSQIPCLFFFREVHIPNSFEKDAPEIWNIYHESDETAKKKTEGLKKRIKERFPERVFSYEITWDPEKKELVGWDAFEELVVHEMKYVMGTILGFSEDINRSAYDLAKLNFSYSFQQDALPITSEQRFTHDRWQLRCLMSREWCKRLRGYWIQSDDQFESSVLMASVAHKWMRDGENIIPYDCGISMDTYDFFFFVKYICWNLACRLDREKEFWELHETVYKTEYEDGSDSDEVLRYWMDLYEAEGEEELIIVVRNWQLTDYEDIQYWYTADPSSGKVHWVFSSTENIKWDGETIYYNKKIVNRDKGFFDPSFVIDSYMQINHKQLAETVKADILVKAEGKPLSYLMILLERLMKMSQSDYDIIRSYGGDGNAINRYQKQLVREMQDDRNAVINEMIESLIKENETDRDLIFGILSLAAAVPYPLPFDYMRSLLEKKGIKWSSMLYSELKNRLGSVLQDNIEDALFFTDAAFKREWISNNKEVFDLWEELLKKDSLSTDEDEKYYGEYYSILQNSREDNVEERLNEAAPFVVPAKLEYFRKRIELCSERDRAAESDIGRFDEAVHFALLDLNCCREVALYGLDIEDRNFENVSCILNNGLLFGLRSDISHVVAELLYFYRECIENRSEKRAELAKDLILYALESREYDVPEELLDELREDSVIG